MTGDQQIKREPLVSIIIPVYNVRKYICEAFDSVINQTYKNLEIIVIDDGSTDGSGRVCDAYAKKDPRIRVIHQENKGLSAARNAGLDVMTGEYVGFLDSDDAFEPEMVECMVRGIEENGVEMAVCGVTTYISTGKLTAKTIFRNVSWSYSRRVVTKTEALNMWLLDDISSACWNKIYKYSLWSNIRFPEGSVFEDLRVFYKILSTADKILLVDRQLVRYRQRKGSITQTQTIENYKDFLFAVHNVERFAIANSPWIFSKKTIERMMDFNLRRMMLGCADLMVHKKGTDREKVRMIRLYLIKRGKKYNKYRDIRTSVTYVLFRYLPYAIPTVRKCYMRIKPIFD